MVKRTAVMLLALGIVGQVSAHDFDLLARFEGGIGVIPVSNGAGAADTDGTLPSVRLNVVRGVSPGAGPWRIADLKADVAMAVAKMWPDVQIQGNNAADALVIASITAAVAGLPVPFPMYQYRSDVVAGLRLPEEAA